MGEAVAETGASPDAQTAHRAAKRALPWLVLLACASLCLTACGTAEPSTTRAASRVGSVAAATAAVPDVPPSSASPLSRADTQTPARDATTAVPSGREVMRGSEITFTSLRNGYSLTVNANDWLVNETPGTWDGTFDPHQLNPDPGTDWFRDPGVATIEIGVLAVPPNTTLAAWEASEAPAVRMLACQEVAPAEPVTVAGATVLLLPETCPRVVVGENRGDQYFLNAFVIHGTSGVVAQWDSEQGHEAGDRASFLSILATWAWASG